MDRATNDEILSWTLDGVAWISLNRPARMNAATPGMMQRLCEVLEAAMGDDAVKALVLTGEGPHFLAGGDFGFLNDMVDSGGVGAGEVIYRWFQGAARLLFNCRKPTVAAISGGAITVGCELALGCDVRIVDQSAFFQESWLDVGLVPPLGGALLLPRMIGLGAAKEMILESRRVDAQEALRLGLVNAIVPQPAQLRESAQQRALALAGRPAAAFAKAKALLHAGLESSISDAWEAGVEAQADCLMSAEFRAAVAAHERRFPTSRTLRQSE